MLVEKLSIVTHSTHVHTLTFPFRAQDQPIIMASEHPLTHDELFEDDAFAASQSLEEELLGKGYLTPLGSSLAAEIQSATGSSNSSGGPLSPVQSNSSPKSRFGPTQERLPPNAASLRDDGVELRSLVVGDVPETRRMDDSILTSPTSWSTVLGSGSSNGLYGRSRRSSFASSSWSSEDEDPFELLTRQLEELNATVWETKTLHKRMFNTILSDDGAEKNPSLELVVTSITSLVEQKSRDRERQTNYLRNVDSSLRTEGLWMSADIARDLDNLMQSIKTTLHDQMYSYDNPVPALHQLKHETTAFTESLEELKELMYVNKRQLQELNSRLRSIVKTVHEVRKDIRRMNKFLEDKDDDEAMPAVLERKEVNERVREILSGLDDLDTSTSKQLHQMQLFWEQPSFQA